MKTKTTINTALVLAVCFILLLVCTGCSSDPVMRERFGGGTITMVTADSTGDKYIIEHHFGDLYTVKPLPKAN